MGKRFDPDDLGSDREYCAGLEPEPVPDDESAPDPAWEALMDAIWDSLEGRDDADH